MCRVKTIPILYSFSEMLGLLITYLMNVLCYYFCLLQLLIHVSKLHYICENKFFKKNSYSFIWSFSKNCTFGKIYIITSEVTFVWKFSKNFVSIFFFIISVNKLWFFLLNEIGVFEKSLFLLFESFFKGFRPSKPKEFVNYYWDTFIAFIVFGS